MWPLTQQHAEAHNVHPHDEDDGQVHGGAHVGERLHAVPLGAVLVQEARGRKEPHALPQQPQHT